MTVKQISFINPVGELFLQAGLTVLEQPEQTFEAADVFRELLDSGLTAVEKRGVIQRHDRKYLKCNQKFSKTPNQGATSIRYTSDEEFEKRVTLIGAKTTMNGRLKVLREAIVEALEQQGVNLDYD